MAIAKQLYFMEEPKNTSIKKALEVSKDKGNEAITRALLEALEEQQRYLKTREAA